MALEAGVRRIKANMDKRKRQAAEKARELEKSPPQSPLKDASSAEQMSGVISNRGRAGIFASLKLKFSSKK